MGYDDMYVRKQLPTFRASIFASYSPSDSVFTAYEVEFLAVYILKMKAASCSETLVRVLSPTRKEISYSDQTRDLFNILPTKLSTLLSPLL